MSLAKTIVKLFLIDRIYRLFSGGSDARSATPSSATASHNGFVDDVDSDEYDGDECNQSDYYSGSTGSWHTEDSYDSHDYDDDPDDDY